MKVLLFRPEQDSNPDLWVVDAVLNQLRYQANWKLVIMRRYDKPVESGYMRSLIGISIRSSNEISLIEKRKYTNSEKARNFLSPCFVW